MEGDVHLLPIVEYVANCPSIILEENHFAIHFDPIGAPASFDLQDFIFSEDQQRQVKLILALRKVGGRIYQTGEEEAVFLMGDGTYRYHYGARYHLFIYSR